VDSSGGGGGDVEPLSESRSVVVGGLAAARALPAVQSRWSLITPSSVNVDLSNARLPPLADGPDVT